MINIKTLTKQDVGRWVRYATIKGETEEGRIKSWNEYHIFVVYWCDIQWERFQEFCAAATNADRLTWLDKAQPKQTDFPSRAKAPPASTNFNG